MSNLFEKLYGKYKITISRDDESDIIIEGDTYNRIWSGRGNDQVFAGDSRDTIFAGSGNDFVDGGRGDDTIHGGNQNDRLHGGDGRDRLFGGNGQDVLKGGHDNDVLNGGRHNDHLYGGAGNDYLNGGQGNDHLTGGMGNDTLIGGQGANHYHFTLKETTFGYTNEGDDKIIGVGKHDTIVFHGVDSLADLAHAVSSIQVHGPHLKIMFTDGGSISINGRGLNHIHDVWDLADKLNITFAHEYREMTGEFNNVGIQYMGASETQFLRMAPADYGDGLNTPAGSNRASAREVSNELFDQSVSAPNPFNASDMFWVWGQFVDHDIDLAEGTSGESFDIPVPLGDPYFDPFFTGTAVIPFSRTGYDHETGIDSYREHLNGITSYLDASMIYGADDLRADFLRNQDGTLKTSDGNFLPFNNGYFDNAGGTGDNLFLAGDVRANENVALTSLHTLFVLEHNRLVGELSQANPDWDGERLYHEARMLVGAEIQAITYNEFLPLLVGQGNIASYTGYDPDVDPRISTEFASAAYRLGHTLLSGDVERLNEDGSIKDSHLLLREAFFSPHVLLETGIEPILRGVSQGAAETVDLQIIDDVRNFLFGPPGAGGLDLGALNVQRGRDHGLADYNTVRDVFGLTKVDSFDDITSDVGVQASLASVYTDVDDIDLFVGLLAEDPIPGSQLGELLQTIIVDQFERTRDGDRFWYENILNPSEVADINSIRLSDIIELNTDIETIQNHVMKSYLRTGGDAGDNTINGTAGSDLLIGFAGMDILIGGAGEDELVGGEDNDTLTGGTQNDTFVFKLGSSLDTILDFALNGDANPENDKMDVTDYQTNYGNLTITQSGADAHIALDTSNIIVLAGIDASLITANDFDF